MFFRKKRTALSEKLFFFFNNTIYMKIYTKTGDSGTTGLLGGSRVKKFDLRVSAYGTVDELNAALGVAMLHSVEPLANDIDKICNLLFLVCSELASESPILSMPSINENCIHWLEAKIDEYTGKMPQLANFILPGGSQSAAYLHLARTVCRRAERLVVELSEKNQIRSEVIKFLNRLSDYLFTASRYANCLAGVDDKIWSKSAAEEILKERCK